MKYINYTDNRIISTITDGTLITYTTESKEYDDVEEITIIRKIKRVPYKTIGTEARCAFDDWDWELHPVAMMYCGCPKCSPRY